MFGTIVLVEDDVPTSIAALLELAETSAGTYRLYAEAFNEDGDTGPARLGGSNVLRHASAPIGMPLQPGYPFPALRDLPPSAPTGFNSSTNGRHDFKAIYITGKTGDCFQLEYSPF